MTAPFAQRLSLLQRLDKGPVICAEGYVFELERRGYLQAGAFVPEVVLDHPEVPLHNNPAELDARTRVRKRVVSCGPRSLAGARTWDAMETLLSTARKLGVNFFQYIRDRVSGATQMPSLADLIKLRAQTMDLGSSWKPI